MNRIPKELRIVLALVYLAAALVVVLVIVASRVLDQPHSVFVIEPAEYYPGVLWYAGFFSGLGVLLWFTSAVACLVAGLVLRVSHERAAKPLALAGAFSTLLVFDDAFQLHDILFASVLGVPEPVVFGAYGLLFVLYLVGFRRIVRASPWPLLAVAAGFFAASLVVDRVHSQRIDLLEEGFKFFGIVTWSTYFVWLAVRHLTSVREEPSSLEAGSIGSAARRAAAPRA